jgi:transcription termination factor Rho
MHDSEKYIPYFPRGIAKGKEFCNRVSEREPLIKNINTHQHTLLMSPSRYGKTSVVRYAAAEAGVMYSEVDLFVAVDAKR